MAKTINIDGADIHVATLGVIEDNGIWYLTAKASKPDKPEHVVIANLVSSQFKNVVSLFAEIFRLYVEAQDEPAVGNDAQIFTIDGPMPDEVGKIQND